MFFCKFARNTPIYSRIFHSYYVLTNTKSSQEKRWLIGEEVALGEEVAQW
jgi:hypothetical protein